jgi:predicted O-methyltransferase YrrM
MERTCRDALKHFCSHEHQTSRGPLQMQREGARPRNSKIAGIDTPSGKDLTQVDAQSEFSGEIQKLFSQIRPQRIIETGTYHGVGTTRIIAHALKELKIGNSIFYSIEINPLEIRSISAGKFGFCTAHFGPKP